MVILGFFFTFMPQFLLGNAGMPRRYYSYPEHYQWLHVLSTAGASVLALGLILVVVYLVVAVFRGKRVGPNPWGSASPEWRVPSPPPTHNFESEVDTRGPYDYEDAR
jgi:cytochrome c oxidase subunit 1